MLAAAGAFALLNMQFVRSAQNSMTVGTLLLVHCVHDATEFCVIVLKNNAFVSCAIFRGNHWFGFDCMGVLVTTVLQQKQFSRSNVAHSTAVAHCSLNYTKRSLCTVCL